MIKYLKIIKYIKLEVKAMRIYENILSPTGVTTDKDGNELDMCDANMYRMVNGEYEIERHLITYDINNLEHEQGEHIRKRVEELSEELEYIRCALSVYDSEE